MKQLILISIFAPLLSSALTTFFRAKSKFFNFFNILFLTIGLSSLIFLLIFGKNTLYINYPWFSLSEYKINFSFYFDKALLMIIIIVLFITIMTFIYSFIYLKEKYSHRYTHFFCLINFFLFALIAFVLSDSLLLLFVFWELMGFCSFKLISFDQNKNLAVLAGNKALIINKLGDLGFLLALVLLFVIFRTFDLNFIKHEIKNLGMYAFPNKFYFYLINLGFILAAVIKSAQIPFSAWLSSAMEAPIPVSALIHSCTIVIVGVLLIYKVNFLIGDFFYVMIAFIGATAAFLASLIAIYQHDIKKILAYSTVAQIGFIYISIGLKNFEIGFLHLIIHAFFKSLLFLLSGLVINIVISIKTTNEANARNLDNIKSISAYIPKSLKTMFLIGLACLSGLPLFASYLSKEAIISLIFQSKYINFQKTLLMILLIMSMLATAIYSTKIASAIVTKNRFYNNKIKINPFLIWPLVCISIFCLFWAYSANIFTLKPFLLSKIIVKNTNIAYGYVLTIFITIVVIVSIIYFYIKYLNKNTYAHTYKIALMLYNELYLPKLYNHLWLVVKSIAMIFNRLDSYLHKSIIYLFLIINKVAVCFRKFDSWVNYKLLGYIVKINNLFAKSLASLELNNLQVILTISFCSLIIIFVIAICFFA